MPPKQKQKQVSKPARDPSTRSAPKPQDAGVAHHLTNSWIKVILLVFVLSRVVKFTYLSIDSKIEGKWRDYPPFSLISHPPVEAHMTVEQIVTMNGFNFSEHTVTTEDGYINKVFRINKGEEIENMKRPAVLMVHGLIDSASCWITNVKEKA